MNKCLGCQKEIPLNKKYCERCFKIHNYNYFDENAIFSDDVILEKINKTNAFVLFLCDFLSITDDVINLFKSIKNEKLFVITKADIIPNTLSENNIIKNMNKNYSIDPLLFSIKSGVGKRKLMEYINKCQTILFAGPSSSGKSSLINYLFSFNLITSSYANTTLDFIKVKYENKNIIDAPGFKNSGYNLIVKKLLTKTMTIKKDYLLIINDYTFSFDKETSITLFLLSDAKVTTKKGKLDNFIDIKNIDVLLPFGFIYIKDSAKLYYNKMVKLRPTLVGGQNE